MDDIARRPARERADLFSAAVTQLGYAPAVVEKDFWVCWLLKRLFSLPGFDGAFVFKGGTSLSKVYGAIDRFSEDVDLVWDREFLGFGGDKDPLRSSQTKAEKELIPELIEAARVALRERLVPALERAVAEHLGRAASLSISAAEDDQPAVHFAYPRVRGITSDYVAPHVVLELVPRSEPEPSDRAAIRPYLFAAIPQAFRDPDVAVRHINVARTFWEKVTILHMYHHYPAGKAFGPRCSRHYYDTVRLFLRGLAEHAFADAELLRAVVRHKKRFYRSGPARYDEAATGLLRLVPVGERLELLRLDYEAMGEMFFGAPPGFDDLMAALGEIEARVNAMMAPAGG